MQTTTAHSQQPSAPLRPPEHVDTHKKKCSFRDKLLGNQEPVPRRETVDLIGKNLFRIEFEDDESLLLALATAVGSPVKVDMHTLDASRGKFARVCIEIDLDKPVVGKVWFRDFWYHVEYEGLHLLCKSCGIYGHVARNCPTASARDEKKSKVSSAKEANDVVEGTSKISELMVAPTNIMLNKEGSQAEAEFKANDL
ncbi:zinc ion binding / nucleic acid binding protein [Trifolium repens]|nr:zinc ion binding / nucleic acid binding protein [Trifolium repens]